MSNISVSTSFVQSNKHDTKSNRFQSIQPSKIAEVLLDHGFDLATLKTGIAKSLERQDYQTTVATYRSRDQFELKGMHFDLKFKIPHLYGALQAYLGIFRLVCKNGLVAGHNYQTLSVKHLGNPYEILNAEIPRLVAQRDAMVAEISAMQNTELSQSEMILLAAAIAEARLKPISNVVKFESTNLLVAGRHEDVQTDLFTVFNVIQENLLRKGLQYQFNSFDSNGVTILRNATSRRIKDTSVAAIDLNQAIWDVASNFIKAA